MEYMQFITQIKTRKCAQYIKNRGFLEDYRAGSRTSAETVILATAARYKKIFIWFIL